MKAIWEQDNDRGIAFSASIAAFIEGEGTEKVDESALN